MRHISDFITDENILDFYLCKSKQTFETRTGKKYLSLVLQDKTGTINAKVWELNNDIQSFEENDFIKIDGIVTLYKSEHQLNIRKIRRANEGEYEPSEYIPVSTKNITDMFQKIVKIISSMKNTYVKQLMENIYINDKEINGLFTSHSAAKTMHHNYMGGLLEHTLSIVEICDFLSSHYEDIDRDLLIATALLHDTGKIYELSTFPNNDYTDDGQLLGHITMGVELVNRKADEIEDFPHKLRSLIKHGILSHHGQYEYGSPKRPKTKEAFILSSIDELDAKLKMYEDMISSDKTQGSWAGYNKMLSLNIRKTEY